MAERLVVIAQFPDYIEAEMARQTLADCGIEAIVTGANASSVYPVPAIEGPELHVPESQAREAREILESRQEQEQ